jgi:hypothetical protein
MAVIKNQEITDAHTGVHLAIDEHVSTDGEGGPETRKAWLRISMPVGEEGGEQKISTIYFDAAGEPMRMAPHPPAEPAPEPQPELKPLDVPAEFEIKEEKKSKSKY